MHAHTHAHTVSPAGDAQHLTPEKVTGAAYKDVSMTGVHCSASPIRASHTVCCIHNHAQQLDMISGGAALIWFLYDPQHKVAVDSSEILGRNYLSLPLSALLSVACQYELIHYTVLEMLNHSQARYLGNKPCMAEERCCERKKMSLTLLK